MASSTIEWTEMTWNPSTGCSKISSGCKNCYAEVMTRRLNAMGIEKYKKGFKLSYHSSELLTPFKWKKPRIVFVNSMSDLFHEEMPYDFIKSVFKVMNNCPQHIFQVLTKRANILQKYSPLLEWSENIWMGVTVEDINSIDRIDLLRKTSATIKFLSLEPLLSPLPNLNLLDIDWVIVGGESGPKARPVSEEWVIDIKEQCERKNIPFFFKQWGGKNKKQTGKELMGKVYNQMPLSIIP